MNSEKKLCWEVSAIRFRTLHNVLDKKKMKTDLFEEGEVCMSLTRTEHIHIYIYIYIGTYVYYIYIFIYRLWAIIAA